MPSQVVVPGVIPRQRPKIGAKKHLSRYQFFIRSPFRRCYFGCSMTMLSCRLVRGGKKLVGRCSSPSPVILLPLGEWPCNHLASSDCAGHDQPGLGGSGEPSSVQAHDEATDPAFGPILGPETTGDSSRPSVSAPSSEDNPGGPHMLEHMRVTLRESGMVAQALQDALREISHAVEPGTKVENLWPS